MGLFNKGKIRELEIEIARLEQEAEDRRKLPMFDYELVEDTTELGCGAQPQSRRTQNKGSIIITLLKPYKT